MEPTTQQKIFFTSDTHYAHHNLVKSVSSWSNTEGCRDYPDVRKMNDAIVDGINRKVGTTDILFHLGDFCFGDTKNYREFRSRIRCQNIYLIYGNHDIKIIRNLDELQGLFRECSFYREATINGQKIIMSHYGFRVWNQSHMGAWMLHGHSHGSLKPSVSGDIICTLLDEKKYSELRMLATDNHPTHCANGKTMDVGVDTHWDFSPYSFDEIVSIMNAKTIAQVDGHISNKNNK